MRETKQELNDARLKRVKELLEALTQRLEGGTVSGVSKNVRKRGGVAKRIIKGTGEKRWRELEIPLFAGDDTYGWVNRLERYF